MSAAYKFLFSWSYRRELYYVSLAVVFLLSLPVLAVLTITNVGIEAVSNLLVKVNESTNTIQLNYPNGDPYKEISINTVWPTTGVITNEFGSNNLPYQVLHTGIDIAGSRGDPITPFMSGKVIYAGSISWGYGKHVIVDHGDNITAIYAHLSQINVGEGQNVKPGDVIGLEGSTGWSTGNHLHFEVKVFGVPVEPRVFLL